MGELNPSPEAVQEAPGIIDKVFEDWQEHLSSPKDSTNQALLSSIRARYTGWSVTVTSYYPTGLFAYAKAGHAEATLDTKQDKHVMTRAHKPARGRKSGNEGTTKNTVTFGKYDYTWNRHTFIVYHASFTENMRETYNNLYILSKTPDGEVTPTTTPPKHVDELIVASTEWNAELHNEILVFDQQRWSKDGELYRAVQSANWNDVVLDKDIKDALIKDVESFFDCQADYKRFAVPWKRGIIFHGTPGNGKTISIKALMNSLSRREGDAVPSLYVKSLAGCNNAYYAIRQIFVTARHYSPCLLIFEDLDSLISDSVKSFFLNEVDGLEDNDGLMMIGSTNYLERLDAGISRRPGRFDRKYHFALPAASERAKYADYWRQKLQAHDNDLDFPEALNDKIAGITEDFSFAYIKEAFVTSLLTIVGAQKKVGNPVDEKTVEGPVADDMDHVLLWRVMKKQVATLREEMEGARKSAEQAAENLAKPKKGGNDDLGDGCGCG